VKVLLAQSDTDVNAATEVSEPIVLVFAQILIFLSLLQAGETALMKAVGKAHVDVVKLLLACPNINVNAQHQVL